MGRTGGRGGDDSTQTRSTLHIFIYKAIQPNFFLATSFIGLNFRYFKPSLSSLDYFGHYMLHIYILR